MPLFKGLSDLQTKGSKKVALESPGMYILYLYIPRLSRCLCWFLSTLLGMGPPSCPPVLFRGIEPGPGLELMGMAWEPWWPSQAVVCVKVIYFLGEITAISTNSSKNLG